MTSERKWIPLICVVVIALFAIPAITVYLHSQQMPDYAAVPMVAAPSPNARDTFMHAEAMIPDSDKEAIAWAFAKTTPIPPPGTNLPHPTTGYRIVTPTEKQKVVQENLPAIAEIRQGLTQPYFYSHPVDEMDDPDVGRLRGLARLLRLQTYEFENHGDWNDAMASTLDGIQLGRKMQYERTTPGLIMEEACEYIVRGQAYDIVNHLNLNQAKAAAQRLARMDPEDVPLSDIVQADKLSGQAMLQEQFGTPNWRRQFSSFKMHLISPRQIYNDYTRYMDAVIAIEKLPWPQQFTVKIPKKPGDDLNQQMCLDISTYSKVGLKSNNNTAVDRMLEIALALHAYDLDHHEYPASLSQLTPTYLPVVPLDPFSNNQPLKYKRNGRTYIIYSIGPDAVDNGGTPIENSGGPTQMPVSERYLVYEQGQSGDIVFGVNQ